MTESFGYSRLQEEPGPIEGGKETREGNGYDNNTQVEGDTTYNAEESEGNMNSVHRNPGLPEVMLFAVLEQLLCLLQSFGVEGMKRWVRHLPVALKEVERRI